MQRLKSKNLIRILIGAPFLLVLYILQGMVFTRLRIWGSVPLLLPIAVCGVALFDGAVSGGVFGIFAGMLCDMSFNQPTIAFTLILTFIGIGAGLLSDTILVRGFPSYFIVSVCALAVCSFCQMFAPLFLRGAALAPLLDTAARQLLASLVFTIPMYYLTRFVSRVL